MNYMCFNRAQIIYWQRQASQQVSIATIAQPPLFWHWFIFLQNNHKQNGTIKNGKEKRRNSKSAFEEDEEDTMKQALMDQVMPL